MSSDPEYTEFVEVSGGILTTNDRKMLVSENRQAATDSEKIIQRRHRMRKRVRQGLSDGVLLCDLMSDPDCRQVFNLDEDNREDERVLEGIAGLMGFIWRGFKLHGKPEDLTFNQLINRGIMMAEKAHNPNARIDVSVHVDLDVKSSPSIDGIYQRFKEGRPLGHDEVGRLLTSGKVSDPDELQELSEYARSFDESDTHR